MNRHRSLVLALVVTLLIPLTGPGLTSAIQHQGSLSGWFLVLWDDPQAGEPAPAGPAYLVRDDAGRSIRLFFDADLLSAQGGILALDRRRVTVTGRWLSDEAIAVDLIQLDPGASRAGPPLSCASGTGVTTLSALSPGCRSCANSPTSRLSPRT